MNNDVSVYWYEGKLVYSYEVNGVYIHGFCDWKGGAE